MTVTVYGIANCDSVRKARAWLQAEGVEFAFHDFKRDGLDAALVDRWLGLAGWQTLLNRRGTTWRRLDESARGTAVDAAGARALMLAQPSLVKRPVVQWADGAVTVGFDPAQFARSARRS